jgi:hypothetical protein
MRYIPRAFRHLPPAGICMSLVRIASQFHLRGAIRPVIGSISCAAQNYWSSQG